MARLKASFQLRNFLWKWACLIGENGVNNALHRIPLIDTSNIHPNLPHTPGDLTCDRKNYNSDPTDWTWLLPPLLGEQRSRLLSCRKPNSADHFPPFLPWWYWPILPAFVSRENYRGLHLLIVHLICSDRMPVVSACLFGWVPAAIMRKEIGWRRHLLSDLKRDIE